MNGMTHDGSGTGRCAFFLSRIQLFYIAVRSKKYMCENYKTMKHAGGGTSYKAGKCSMRAVGCGTSVGEAYAVYLQSTYMELSLPGSVGAARKVARGGKVLQR